MNKPFIVSILATIILTACGGGGTNDDGTPKPTVDPKAVYPVPMLRPCETTSPTAPPCAASQSQGTH